MHSYLITVLCSLVAFLTSSIANAEAGIVRGLLIGNGKYDHFPNAELKRTAKDIEDLGNAIKAHRPDSSLIALPNAGNVAIREAWETHLAALKDGDTSLFFFSGHGTEIEGHSYLLPTDIRSAQMRDTATLNTAALGLGALLDQFHTATRDRNIAGIFIIDACRDSRPLRVVSASQSNDVLQPQGTRADEVPAAAPPPAEQPEGEIAAVPTPPGMVVLYSAATRQAALETLGANDHAKTSLYVRKLVELLAEPKSLQLPVEQLAKQLRWIVYLAARDEAEVSHTQTPAYIDEMLEHRNLLGSKVDQGAPPPVSVNPQRHSAAAGENDGGPRTKGLGLPPIIKDCDQCPELVELPRGNFLIGTSSDDPRGDESERPTTRISIDYRFALGRFEVSRDQWLACQLDKAYGKCRELVDSNELGRDLRKPITNVTWDDARAYVEWLNTLLDREKKHQYAHYRLPSEAEWEYGARAGSGSAYSFGDDPSDLCRHANGADASLKTIFWSNWLCKDGNGRGTAQIDSYLPNAFGLHNMHGNVWEWTADCWAPSHMGIDSSGKPRTSGDCDWRVVRGGSWRSGPEALRAAKRIGLPAAHARGTLGFRVALDLVAPDD